MGSPASASALAGGAQGAAPVGLRRGPAAGWDEDAGGHAVVGAAAAAAPPCSAADAAACSAVCRCAPTMHQTQGVTGV